jgi:hypothetical protein
LPRYATRNRDKPEYLDPRQITLLVFFLDQPAGGKPLTLYFDNVRLAREATGKIEVRPAAAAGSQPKPALGTPTKPER